MAQFLPPRAQQFPVAISDLKTRLKVAEHKLEGLTAANFNTGAETFYSDTVPNSARVGDVWFQTSLGNVIATYTCITTYTPGTGTLGDWSSYTSSGQVITPSTVTNTQIASATILGSNIASATITGGNIASATITGTNIGSATITGGNIASGTITGTNIGSATITGSNLVNATITATQIANATITGAKIASATITGSNIGAATIAGSNIVNGTITATQIANATITSSQISATAGITGSQIASGTITASNIVAGTITATQIATGTITGSQIAGGTITGSNIQSATITNTQIASGTITGSNIGASTITGANLANATITNVQISNGTITTTQISNTAGITGTQIATGTVSGSNIAAGTITASNIAAATITGGLIAASTINGSNIAAGTITAGNIQSGTITGTQIAGTTITASNIVSGTITATQIAAKSITNATLAAWAIDGVVSQAAFHGLNMIPDPQFSNSTVNTARTSDPITAGSWTLSGGQAQATNVNGSANILALLSSASTNKPTWVNPGEQYYYSVTVNRSGASTNQIGIQFVGNTTITQSTTASGTNTLSGTFTIPSGWNSMYVRFFANSSATADVITWSNPVLQPATLFSPTITGGTITGGTITGGTINGSVFNGTNWIENSSGSFFYSGTPALGNLVLSMTQQTGFDAFGNAYGQGFRVYGPNSAAMNMLLTGSTPLLAMQPGGMAHISSAGSLNSQGVNSGAVNEVQLVVVTSGQESSHDDAALQLWSATADNTSGARAVIEFGGQAVAQFDRTNLVSAIQPGTTTTTETWHTGTLGNGWTGTLKYRLNVLNEVEVFASGLDGSANTNAIFFQLPTGYRPATTQVNPAFCTSLTYSGQVGVQCNASGQLSMLATTITNKYDFHHFISLDL